MAAPAVVPRSRPKSIKVLPTNGTAADLSPIGVHAMNGGDRVKTNTHLIYAQREVELVNHCFADVEHFMARLQQTAEAKNIQEQLKRSKKKSRKKKTKPRRIKRRTTSLPRKR